MQGSRLIHQLQITNFLSYGSPGETINLEPLNVIIGPNASGKSNLLEMLGLLRALPQDLSSPIREGGGIREWLWKGDQSPTLPVAQLEALVSYPDGIMPLRYRIQITAAGQRLEIVDEAIENAERTNPDEADVYFFYRYQTGNPVLNVRTVPEAKAGEASHRTPRGLRREDLKPDQSVLAQRKDPDQYPELTYLGSQFAEIRLYREWNLGRYTPPRMPQKPDLPEDFLSEDASNLGLVLNNLQSQIGTRRIVSYLKKFYEPIEEIIPRISGGSVQLFIREEGLSVPIPATRLSDGTLRYLCLLTILCHPTPPPLICLEEPELGLHPDVIPTIAELLIEASQRTQLVVTTHSDALISALSEVPEAILVCERTQTGSHLRRLEREPLKEWLDNYTLGDLWRMGELGGVK
ncbi:MAG: AAA family ATPase [Pegethrix bostrychoides GSE-TBD4-15B]|jgi:predicted ATPase|uniref:AAA family ATPase n=1 Tax=Pegethrix bostrychoides GSE-TBD4-15B TaxID=2839662 RepID=A0A951PEV4_9CYAN|nr:AAA family ATPase [Pegethrix bostrychoides GSE-TBD4-15B]